MSDNIKDLCQQIRELNENKREILLTDGLLESMATTSLEAFRDWECEIEQIICNHSRNLKNISKIQKLISSDENIKIKVAKIMDDIGAKRVEDLAAFSETLLRLLTETQGEVK